MITVDDRQPSETTPMLLGMDIPAKTERMVFGDEAWDSPMGRVVVEEKALSDLLTSALGTGRLDEQLVLCVDGSDIPILMILGEVGERWGTVTTLHGGWKPVKYDFDRLDNLLVEWQLRGVIIKHCPDPEHRVFRLASLYNFTTKQEHREFFVRQRKMPNLGRLGGRAECLASMPGIGAKRAARLAEFPASLRDMAAWPLGTWKAHVGPAAGKRVHDRWGELP